MPIAAARTPCKRLFGPLSRRLASIVGIGSIGADGALPAAILLFRRQFVQSFMHAGIN